MTRTILSSLAIAAVLTAGAAPPAASQNRKPKEIVVVGSGAKQAKTTPGASRTRPGKVAGSQGQQKAPSESISLNFEKIRTRSAPRSRGCATPGNCWPTHKPQN